MLRFFLAVFFLSLLSWGGAAQPGGPMVDGGLRWRMIGPFRGGRTVAVSGVEGDPNTYYFGGVGGGIWKTSNGGLTWTPIFDSQPIASIGALAVAPSNPSVIYAGSGEADLRSDLTYGNGVYKSTDAGQTWTHLEGLRDSRHISRILVDPRDPNLVLAAVLGHAYGPNAERGVFRSIDGGASWQRVLYKDENTGAIDLAMDPDNPRALYAALWSARRPPWSVYPPTNGSGALWRSSDGGVSWTQVTGGGLPSGEWGRIGVAVARGSHGQRVYALIDTREGGLFRSDDGGRNWMRVGTDDRIRGRLWYFCEVDIDPQNPDVVYLPNVSIYRSTDAGRTFTALKGAPGGDDYHTLWIDPAHPRRLIFGSDQGAGISVDGGQSWSSWYNQPTAQFYHVATDRQFPYRVYGAQQDSGTISIASRSDYGSITFRDWYSIGAGESGYIAPDPADSNIVYGGDTYGGLHRFDRRTGQSQDIAPAPLGNFGAGANAALRFTWTSPLVFSPHNAHTLYFGSQFVLRSENQGMSWEKISPDLTGSQPGVPQTGPTTVENAKARGHGVVYTIAPSPVNAAQIWAGSDTGLVHLTRDGGKNWLNVTPSGLGDWSKISLLEASHFDAAVAYAAVDRHRLDDGSPLIYRTRDYGQTWSKIVAGLPEGAYIRAVREDPARKGLLFAGTERGVYFSLDDGDSWQSLQLNMPFAPVHDLVVKDNDLVIATHGRSFWILDDISPLRQMAGGSGSTETRLFQPATAMRLRANVNHDTPLPPETPAGENPPTGAIVYYFLKSPAQEVTLETLDAQGRVLRRYSSHDQPSSPPVAAFPSYWFRPSDILSAVPGMHRFVWDLRYAPPPVRTPQFSMSTAFGQNTPTEPEGPRVLPGSYQIRLTVDGKTFTQPANVVMDPRVAASRADMEKQFALELKLHEALRREDQALREIRDALGAPKDDAVKRKLEGIAGTAGGRRAEGEDGQESGPTLQQLGGTLARLAGVVDTADADPTAQASAAAEEALGQLQSLLDQWKTLKQQSMN